jgi:hypothetical protein
MQQYFFENYTFFMLFILFVICTIYFVAFLYFLVVTLNFYNIILFPCYPKWIVLNSSINEILLFQYQLNFLFYGFLPIPCFPYFLSFQLATHEFYSSTNTVRFPTPFSPGSRIRD